MKWRAPYPEVGQRGHGYRLWEKIAKHVSRDDAMVRGRWRKLIKDG